MTPLRRALLSGFTLFGGHFVNRRLDRVGLIGVLLTVAVVGTVCVARAMPFDNSGLRILVWLPMGLLVLVVLIALVSARLTFHDAPQAAQRRPTLTIRVIRFPVTLFGALTLALVAAAGISSLPYLGGMHMRSTARPVGTIEFGSSASIGGYGTVSDALRCARLHVADPRSERDALIAAAALVHGMTIATRSVEGFLPTGVETLNPWEWEPGQVTLHSEMQDILRQQR